MDEHKPISSDMRRLPRKPSAALRRAGFGVAPILYMLGLIGVGAGILFSSYSQNLKTNIQMTNSLAVKSDIEGAATTLAATSVLGSTDNSILCPPRAAEPVPTAPTLPLKCMIFILRPAARSPTPASPPPICPAESRRPTAAAPRRSRRFCLGSGRQTARPLGPLLHLLPVGERRQ